MPNYRVTFRRTIEIERTIQAESDTALRAMIREFGAHDWALDGDSVLDVTRVVKIRPTS